MCFIEKTQYPGWSQEVKEIYDAHKGLRIVLSGSSLVKLNDGDADLSRRMVPYMIPGLSLREYIILEKGLELPSIALEDLLASPNSFCAEIIPIYHSPDHSDVSWRRALLRDPLGQLP